MFVDSDSQWIDAVLQNCLIGGEVRLQEFPDTRASIVWASNDRPTELTVERFVLDPQWAKGPTTHRELANDSWCSARRPVRMPRSWLPAFRGGAFLEELDKRGLDTTRWHSFVRVPVILGDKMLGGLSIEVRMEALEAAVAEAATRPHDDRTYRPQSPFNVLHAAAAAIAYARLWRQGNRRASFGTAIVEAFQRFSLRLREFPEGLGASSSIETAPLTGPDAVFRLGCQLGLFGAHSSRIEVVDVTSRLVEMLRDRPEHLSQLTPEQFEQLVANRLDRMGFDVVSTGAVYAPDGGIDLIATPKTRGLGSFLLAAQVKHHRNGRPATREDIDRLLAWKDSAFRLGMIVTNTRFTDHARWVGERHKSFLRLREFVDVCRWLREEFAEDAEWAELPTSIELAPGVVITIPRISTTALASAVQPQAKLLK